MIKYINRAKIYFSRSWKSFFWFYMVFLILSWLFSFNSHNLFSLNWECYQKAVYCCSWWCVQFFRWWLHQYWHPNSGVHKTLFKFFFQLYFNERYIEVVINDLTMHLIILKWLRRQKYRREKRWDKKSLKQKEKLSTKVLSFI